MRSGLVGVFTNYRQQNFKGAKYGVIDVVFDGDLDYPTETHEIKVYDPHVCAFLIATLSKIRNPILTMSCWIDIRAKEPFILLLEVVSVDDPKNIREIGGDYGREHTIDSGDVDQNFGS